MSVFYAAELGHHVKVVVIVDTHHVNEVVHLEGFVTLDEFHHWQVVFGGDHHL